MTIDDYINSARPEERERRRLQMSHSFTWYSPTGKHIPHEGEHEDLFEVVAGMERYVVDNNSNWKADCMLPRAAKMAFIIGRTVQEEQANLKPIYFGAHTANNNLFEFGLIEIEGQRMMQLTRVDDGLRATFDKRALAEESREPQKRSDADFLARRQVELDIINYEKQKIAAWFTPFSSVEAMPEAHKEDRRLLLEGRILMEEQGAYRSYYQAAVVASRCYARLLLEPEPPQPKPDDVGVKTRKEFNDLANRNALNDTALIQNALVLRANILTGDAAPIQMIKYLGMPEIAARGTV